MRPIIEWKYRPAVITVVALGGASVLLLARPSRGQQAAPVSLTPAAAQLNVPAAATAGALTRVEYEITLPAGVVLPQSPRVRVVDAAGALVELLPMEIAQRTPVWTGYRELHTRYYRAGQYQVSMEVEYTRADGTVGTLTTPARPLSAPGAPAHP